MAPLIILLPQQCELKSKNFFTKMYCDECVNMNGNFNSLLCSYLNKNKSKEQRKLKV